MSAAPRARCPLCAKSVPVFWWGRLIYEHHYEPGATPRGDKAVCDASGWLVEDDELIDRPRKVRSDAGRAR